ncbi:hypothetical protein BOX15_Mlig025850g1, partial [Macrostomum lignano]
CRMSRSSIIDTGAMQFKSTQLRSLINRASDNKELLRQVNEFFNDTIAKLETCRAGLLREIQDHSLTSEQRINSLIIAEDAEKLTGSGDHKSDHSATHCDVEQRLDACLRCEADLLQIGQFDTKLAKRRTERLLESLKISWHDEWTMRRQADNPFASSVDAAKVESDEESEILSAYSLLSTENLRSALSEVQNKQAGVQSSVFNTEITLDANKGASETTSDEGGNVSASTKIGSASAQNSRYSSVSATGRGASMPSATGKGASMPSATGKGTPVSASGQSASVSDTGKGYSVSILSESPCIVKKKSVPSHMDKLKASHHFTSTDQSLNSSSTTSKHRNSSSSDSSPFPCQLSISLREKAKSLAYLPDEFYSIESYPKSISVYDSSGKFSTARNIGPHVKNAYRIRSFREWDALILIDKCNCQVHLLARQNLSPILTVGPYFSCVHRLSAPEDAVSTGKFLAICSPSQGIYLVSLTAPKTCKATLARDKLRLSAPMRLAWNPTAARLCVLDHVTLRTYCLRAFHLKPAKTTVEASDWGAPDGGTFESETPPCLEFFGDRLLLCCWTSDRTLRVFSFLGVNLWRASFQSVKTPWPAICLCPLESGQAAIGCDNGKVYVVDRRYLM